MKVMIPAAIYFLIWILVGAHFWEDGFTALEQIQLPDSVPAAFISLFKYSLLFVLAHSLFYAIIFPQFQHKPKATIYALEWALRMGIISMASYGKFPEWKRIINNAVMSSLLLFACRRLKALPDNSIRGKVLHISYTDNEIENSGGPFLEDMDGVQHQAYFSLYDLQKMLLQFLHRYPFPKFVCNTAFKIVIYLFSPLLHYMLDFKLTEIHGHYQDIFYLVFMVALLTSGFWTVISKDEDGVKAKVERRINSFLSNNKKVVKLVKFTIRILGMVLFQYLFKLTSWDHVKAFLCITVSWLAILVILCVSDDLGFFDFLIENMVLGCTVNLYALGHDTWFAYAAVLVLYGLRVLVESVPLEDNRGLKVIPLQMRPNSFLGKLLVRLIRHKRSKEMECAEVKMQGRDSVADVENGTQDSESADVVENKAQDDNEAQERVCVEIVINNQTREWESAEDELKEREIVEHKIQQREGIGVVENETQERASVEIVTDNQPREWGSVEEVEGEQQERESVEIVEAIECGTQER